MATVRPRLEARESRGDIFHCLINASAAAGEVSEGDGWKVHKTQVAGRVGRQGLERTSINGTI